MKTKTLSLLILVFILVFIYFIPDGILFANNAGTNCLHVKLFGFGCPGCGMTRALHAFLHFDFKDAAQYNFAIFGLFPFLIYRSTDLSVGFIEEKWMKKIITTVFLVLLLVQYGWRFIQYQAF